MIKRAPRPSGNFYILRNQIAEDDSLSLQAIGLLIFLLTRPDNWEVSENHLRKKWKIGRDKTRSLLAELSEAGYAKVYQTREEGKFAKNNWIITETPFTEKPFTDSPLTENTTLNKNLSITRTDNNKLSHNNIIDIDWIPDDQILKDIEYSTSIPVHFIVTECLPGFCGHNLGQSIENKTGELLKWCSREWTKYGGKEKFSAKN
jgi:hypothetical protein